ncbi:unnamed protein product (macronuclear) [Paramecium tetraurelia]|uniref:EF-hand domain-containing protein n=1 Tax=Paramecium tetraurelia TaxID=5888 RepID=A0E0C4_PARTE|nr:uncharacterized protein GSPATT00021909001 [Paramecium tetraurelia]CAK88741.1 unnamed protein product [Paramecium tetraurelia]|eukprot:XP_001456138.1 hypothetical protein (macronuclear) [Paramecium tetraurelia strain d4-2]
MKQRPRQIDASKPVLTISTLEAFNHAEGQETEIKNTEQIITPDQLMKEKSLRERISPFSNVKSRPCSSILALFIFILYSLLFRPKQFEEPTLKSQLPARCREDYIQYKVPVYPDATTYELTEEDVHFLQTINEKLQILITIEDFELYLALLDAKSGKDVEIDFSEFLKLKPILPRTINQQTITLQEQLYNYFKKQRQHFSRSLTRFLMHPYYEDSNPHLAFRPRTQPMDRTMKLRRGNAQNTRGVNEMENLGQKIVLLKRDLLIVSNLIDQSIQREKAMEIERRFNFCKFIKEFFDQSKKEKDNNSEIRLWPKDCFVRDCQDRCSINVVERADEMFDNISKEIIQWKDFNEQQRREKQKKEDQILKFEKQIEDLIIDKLKFEEKPPVIVPPVVQQPIQPQIPQIPVIPQEPPDEKMESVARFLATLYLEARKYQLTFDQVLSDQFPIYKIQNPQQQVNSKSIFPFALMQIEGNDMVYKIRKDNCLERNHSAYWESYQDQQITSTLYYQHEYFKEKVNDIMEIADMDQMVYAQGVDDEKLDEEEKLFKKKVKSSSTRMTGVNGGQLK